MTWWMELADGAELCLDLEVVLAHVGEAVS